MYQRAILKSHPTIKQSIDFMTPCLLNIITFLQTPPTIQQFINDSNLNYNSEGEDDDGNEGKQNNYEFPDDHSEDPFAKDDDDASSEDLPLEDSFNQRSRQDTPSTASKTPGMLNATDFAMFQQITSQFAIHIEDITREPKAHRRDLAVVCMVAEMIGHVRDLKALVQSGPSTGSQKTTMPVTIGHDEWKDSEKLRNMIRTRIQKYIGQSKTESYNGNLTKKAQPVEFSLENRVMNYLRKHANDEFNLAHLPPDFCKGDVKSIQLTLKVIKKIATYQRSVFQEKILTNLLMKNRTRSGAVPSLKGLISMIVRSRNPDIDYCTDDQIYAKTSLEDKRRYVLIYLRTPTIAIDGQKQHRPKSMWVWVDRQSVALSKYPKEGCARFYEILMDLDKEFDGLRSLSTIEEQTGRELQLPRHMTYALPDVKDQQPVVTRDDLVEEEEEDLRKKKI
ncbi:uncharacterized protein MELLADRAFT_66024 [Melampsora larici-populina 98AG31]|uniref:Uncharacterized protein n=1 Tax=Melampsora larici-populina (strain 98AG31 / pathotype 3-4-7) TaxID=747676 RepID=F4RXL7_MELLP|nr:uncharacterized protein MELLADRAFT_66024 [Melampsora larici-populina 98AG31]EGG02745.1 hypothetical protein MELLADRAFT_66024 [Melampsora larici-populina 98AG31]